MSRVIETAGLTKYYGDTAGIVDLDLAVEEGEVFGFIGPNGAGKTTTIRLLLDFIRPTRGSGAIFGMDIGGDSLSIRRRVGYLPGDLALYPSMTGREFLFYFSGLRGIDTASTTAALAERFDLDLDRRIKEYSKGNRQKVGVVNAFMHEPELLILDEPTGGLDPLMQQEFAELLREVRNEGRTVFLSSHYLPEVERVADRVGIVRQGRLIAVDTLDGFRSKVQSNLSIEFESPVDPADFAGIAGVTVVDTGNGGAMLRLSVGGSQQAVLEAAAARGVRAITSAEADLDDVFLSYYGPDGDPASGG
ncbi:MAG: ABC transporter ATP-binding protein [bacterium]|nr:ABC transporter ATP-binding protein [bacterium]MDE0290745.1 ABC transporter ATP-binding protein [bacterium]MDE0440049.1 ABC transporter ATP-binding protein [bacterium]